LDEILEKFANIGQIERPRKQVLVAPSWQADNVMELCLEEIVKQLADKDLCLIIRPHPEFVKRFSDKMQSIIDTYKDRLDENFIIQTDFSSNETVFLSDLVITDWSSIAQEFSYSTKKPSLFINTPMKVMNPEYKRIPCVPLDISLRDEIGISIDTDKLDTLYDTVKYLIEHKDEYREKITLTLNRNIYNIGHSNQVAGDYIITTLAEKAKRKKSNL
jgi:YidC/Oxa1 family membrane protein insertase